MEQFSRAELIFGKEGMARLAAARVAVFGVGGVGGFAVEALARSGVGSLDLVDDDKVCLSNINRQLHATMNTLGRCKVDVARERVLEINPDAVVTTHKLFYLPNTSAQIDLSQYDYIVDAIDTIAGKIELVMKAHECGTPIISSMGAGNKVDAAAFEVADIYATTICPIAKVMRQELRRCGIPELKVVYSKEPVIPPREDTSVESKPDCEAGGLAECGVDLIESTIVLRGDAAGKCSRKRRVPGSTAFVPPVVGLILAGEVVKDLVGIRNAGNDLAGIRNTGKSEAYAQCGNDTVD